MKHLRLAFFAATVFAAITPAFATVVVSSPADGTTVGPQTTFVAKAGTTCSKGVAAMGVYVDNHLAYVANGSTMNASVSLTAGKHYTVVQEWDYCGGATKAPLNLTVQTVAGVWVSSPINQSTIGPDANFAATSTSDCPAGVSAMGVSVNNQLVYKVNAPTLNTNLTLPVGVNQTSVQAWDNCGGTTSTAVSVTVANGTKLANLQTIGGWNQWGELAPLYNICNAPCSGVNWLMSPGISANSLSGKATQFNLGGTTPYSDVLWSNKLIGQGTTLNMPDTAKTLLPSIHHLTYDTDVYVDNLAATQDLEFDVNLYMYSAGMEWGTECNHLNGGVWDIWDNLNAHWVHTTVPCTLNEKAWNHVSFQVQRETNNDLTYQTLTVNGVTYQINQTVPPFAVPSSWYGMTVNYQMDGNSHQTAYMTMLDNLSVTYW